MKETNEGQLVISLDFELLWGVFDVLNYKESTGYFENTRTVIKDILDCFEKSDIEATWATVGMLFNEDWDEWEENVPEQIPHYENPKLSAYIFGRSIKSRSTEKLCFAPDIIKRISMVKGQEIGTHTYSHYYCLETGQSEKSFRSDLEKAIEVANKYDTPLRSLVFPRNQLRQDYLKICAELNIQNIRSNPTTWYWKNTTSNSLLTRLARTGDAYLPLGKKTYKILNSEVGTDLPLEQKASRFFRPVEGNNFLRKSKMRRIMTEMDYAARNGEIYHLWWHPHNFGHYPKRSLEDLETILSRFKKLNMKYGFESKNMSGLNN